MDFSQRGGLRAVPAAGALVLAAVLSVAGCHSGSAQAHASAIATSSVAQKGKTDARTLFEHCIPQSAIGQVNLLTSKSARQRVYACAGVPKEDIKPAAACALSNLEHAGKPPKGRQAKEAWVLDAAYPCAQKYQGKGAGGSQ
jgi:hypothetical protein